MSRRVLVLGGGISGLATAHALLQADFDVDLFEASDQLGGLGTFFKRGELFVDRFYHCIMPSDTHLLKLIDDVGLTDALYWKQTTMGVMKQDEVYPFNSAFDLLRFNPLPLPARVRLGIGSVMLRWLRLGRDLDGTTVEAWLKPIFGRLLWTEFWKPMFEAKFGDGAETLPAVYLFERLGRESNVARRGYLEGGHRRLIGAIAESIVNQGGRIHLETPVKNLSASKRDATVELEDGQVFEGDWVVSTVPLPTLRKLTKNTSLASSLPNLDIPYQGVINVLFFLSRSLTGHYWMPTLDKTKQFDGLVEMSALVKAEQYGGSHLVYAMKYTSAKSPLFTEQDDAIAARWTQQLLSAFRDQGLRPEHIQEVRVFRAPFVEPIYPVGYGKVKPGMRIADSRGYLATSAQVYPQITAWNSSVGLAQKVVSELATSALQDAAKTKLGAGAEP